MSEDPFNPARDYALHDPTVTGPRTDRDRVDGVRSLLKEREARAARVAAEQKLHPGRVIR